jgi:hypothetical protein
MNILALWRSPTGGVNLATGAYIPASTAPSNAAGNWQMVGRGIEDMGVQYTQAGAAPAYAAALPWPAPLPGNSPLPVAGGAWGTIVWQVQVTLTGRTVVEGQQFRTAGASDFRSRLTSVTTPRAALAALSTAPMPFTWQ